jgi:hypothetical protein
VCVLWWLVVVSKVREVFLGWGLRDDKKVESNVTAAYATIMYRLGVVVTRLLAAAFWLGVRIDDIAVVRRTGDSTWRLRVTVELYLYYYKGDRAQGTRTRRYGAANTYIGAESQGDSCSPSTSGEAYTNNTSPILPLLEVV